MGLPENLKKYRKQKGYKQKDLAQWLGITASTYCGYETGKREPSITQLSRIATYLGISTSDLIDAKVLIGAQISNFRNKQHCSIQELANNTGIPITTIERYERGYEEPSFEDLSAIAFALNVNPSKIDERLVINLGSDVLVETEDGEYITASMDTREGKMLSRFQALNEAGKDEAIRYIDILLDANKYRKHPIE